MFIGHCRPPCIGSKHGFICFFLPFVFFVDFFLRDFFLSQFFFRGYFFCAFGLAFASGANDPPVDGGS